MSHRLGETLDSSDSLRLRIPTAESPALREGGSTRQRRLRSSLERSFSTKEPSLGIVRKQRVWTSGKNIWSQSVPGGLLPALVFVCACFNLMAGSVSNTAV